MVESRNIMGTPNTPSYRKLNTIINPHATKFGDRDDLNHTIYINKDGKHTWRPLTIINPFLYMDLVDFITKNEDSSKKHGNGWEFIKRRLNNFKSDKIHCASIPIESKTQKSDKGETILTWWELFEQQTISKSLDYSYCLFTDISNFYPSIYTHSIPWALYGKDIVKNNLKDYNKSFGGEIDKKIRKMQHNQTNGIPQGSVLMNFIAEIILGYIDFELAKTLEKYVDDYYIIRYRDDYRIFTNNLADIETISKHLQKVLLELNFNLGSAKTFVTRDIIMDTIKKDKLYWEPYRTMIKTSVKCGKDNQKITLQKHLLEILKLSKNFPNSGMIMKSLKEFYDDRKSELSELRSDYRVLISILADIMFDNPNSISYCIIIISKILENTDKEEGRKVVDKLFRKYKSKANTDYVEIWLHRLAIMVYDETSKKPDGLFNSILYTKILDETTNLFPVDWILLSTSYKEPPIIDKKMFENMKTKIIDSEIDVLNKDSYY